MQLGFVADGSCMPGSLTQVYGGGVIIYSVQGMIIVTVFM